MSRTATPATSPSPKTHWTVDDAIDLYRVDAWSNGFFTVNERGHAAATPRAGVEIDLVDLVEGLRERGLHTPVLLRFTDILSDRLREIAGAFHDAMREHEYRADYRPVYPVKVNQQHHVVEELSRVGSRLGFGLEVGSKPELLAVMAMSSPNPDQLIICNGFKDARYIEAVILAKKLGRNIIPVVENAGELRLVIDFARRYAVRPAIGVRVKLFTPGEGRWKDSAGFRSKFGLFVGELLAMVRTLDDQGMLDCLTLLHCHAGSQLQNIRKIKDTIAELCHVYVELKRMGAGLSMLDIGGGLGVDYTGDQTNDFASMNYTLREYADDVVYRIKSVCDANDIDHPTIVTECGRAMVAYSSVLITSVLGSTGPGRLDSTPDLAPITPKSPQPILDLRTAYQSVDGEELVACYHDAQQARDEAATLFSLGHLSLQDRALAEHLFWATCTRVRAVRDTLDDPPEALDGLDELLSDVYFMNLSIFQSLPDAWAIDQVFPAMPIRRLDEKPTRHAILADITCDSDGKLDRFVTTDGLASTIPVHRLRPDEPYEIAFFLVGAYQETLGDLHNLFGDAHAVHVTIEDGEWSIEDVVRGDTAGEVLSYLQYDPERLLQTMNRDCERAVRAGRLRVGEARTLMSFYQSGLSSYTYLEPED